MEKWVQGKLIKDFLHFLPNFGHIWWFVKLPQCVFHFEKSSNMSKIWQKMKRSPVQIAFNPFFGWFRAPDPLLVNWVVKLPSFHKRLNVTLFFRVFSTVNNHPHIEYIFWSAHKIRFLLKKYGFFRLLTCSVTLTIINGTVGQKI